MKTVGSQTISTLAKEGYKLFSKTFGVHGLIEIHIIDQDGRIELWTRNDDCAGFVLEYDRCRFEFVRSLGNTDANKI